MKKLIFSVISLLFLLPGISLAQEQEEKLSLDAGSVDSQFEYVIEESNNYQQYEVIPKDWMQKLRSHVADTLQARHERISGLANELQQRENRIEELTDSLAATEAELAETQEAQNKMAFVGMPMEKTTYRLTMWSIIGILILLLLIFIYRFNRSNAVTRQSMATLANVQEEFDQHRKRSLEREQKLRRELQDELNRQRKQK